MDLTAYQKQGKLEEEQQLTESADTQNDKVTFKKN